MANQLKVGSLLSYIQMALGIVVGLVCTPLTIRLLGKSEYGLYNTVSSTIAVLSILNLGFSSSYIRYFAKYKKEGNEIAIYKLNGLFLILFSIIGVVALVCGITLSFNLKWVFDEGLTGEEYRTAKILMFLLAINLAISFPMSVFSNIISANEKFIFLKLISILKTVVTPLTTILFLLMGYHSIAMVVITLIISIVADVIYLIYVKVILKNKFIFRHFEKDIIKSLFIYTSFIAINIIVDQINWNIDKLLLGRYKGTEAVAVYSVGYMLYQYYMMFSTAISNMFIPRVHSIINATKDDIPMQKYALTELFIKVGRIQFLLLGLIGSGVVFFGKPFIFYWAGRGYGESYYVALLLMLPASISLIQNIGIEVQRAQNRHQFRSIAYIIMAVANLSLSIFLCQKWGAIGSAIGTAFSLIVANGIIMNIYYHKKCHIDIILFWKNILRVSLGLIIPLICGALISCFINLYSIWKLLLSIVGYSIIYVISMYFLGMNEYERELIRKPLRRIIKNDRHNKR